MKQVLSPSFSRWGNKGKERLNNLPEARYSQGIESPPQPFHWNGLQTSPVVCPIGNCWVLPHCFPLQPTLLLLPCSSYKDSRRLPCFSLPYLRVQSITIDCTIICALATPWAILSSPSSLSGLNRRGCFWPIKSPFSMFSTFLPLLSSRWEATKGHYSLLSDYTLSPFLVLCETDHASPTFVNFS